MTSALLFCGIILLLFLEGCILAELMHKQKHQKILSCGLALPLATLVNVLFVFLWTVFSVPLTPLSVLLPHGILLAVLVLLRLRIRLRDHSHTLQRVFSWKSKRTKLLVLVCSFILASNALYSFSHAVLLPSFQYDSMTNWTMRSKISWFDKKMAFDKTEDRGMAKPQYPFLFHALQITANQGQSIWSDRMANTILYLLMVGGFLALFELMRCMRGWISALLTLTLIVSIPLLGIHMAQGYGDSLLILYLLLSLGCALRYRHHPSRPMLILSALFVSASVWTKSEGLFFGLVPWFLVVGWMAWNDRSTMQDSLRAGAIALFASIPWPLFVLLKGLRLTPHEGDTTIAWHGDAARELLPATFARGSLGIFAFVLPIAVALLLRKDARIERAFHPFLAWGGIVLLEVFFIYTMTPNFTFLLNGQSYYRQMLVPIAMITLVCVACLKPRSPLH